MDIKDFFFAFMGDWVSLMSGVASVILTIIGVAKKWEKIPPWVFWVTAALCFFVASARVWTTEHREVLKCQNALSETTLPKLSGKISTDISPAGDRGMVVTVEGVIDNGGAPAVLDNWEVSVKFSDGHIEKGRIPNRPLPQDTVTITNNDGRTGKIILSGSYWWPLVTRTKAIEKGHAAEGWITAYFPDIPALEAIKDHITVIVRYSDINKKFWSMEQKIDKPTKELDVFTIQDIPGTTTTKTRIK